MIDTRKLFLALALLYLVVLAMPGCGPATRRAPDVPAFSERRSEEREIRAMAREERCVRSVVLYVEGVR